MTDLTKPVQTASGENARVLATDMPDPTPVWAAYERLPGLWKPLYLRSDGTYPACPDFSLVNVPEPEPLMVTIKMTPEDAAAVAIGSHRLCTATRYVGDASYNSLLAHFTALAEQQRGEG